MRIVAWNIRQGGGSRIAEIIAAVNKLAADVLVISEYRHGNALLSGLVRAGFDHQIARPDPDGGHCGLLVVSCIPLEVRYLRYDSPADGHRFVHAVVNGWNLAAAYIPGSEPPKERKPAFWGFLLDGVEPALRDKPSILLGDLNTGLHYRDEPGATLVCATEMAEFEARGWRDGWISKHRSSRPPATWWSPQARTPYRLDHALFSPAAPLPRSVEYPALLDDGTVLGGAGGLSDHVPLVIDLR